MIIVTGATGKLGHAIVEKLVERVPASRVGVSCREPDRAADLSAGGVRVRRGDFDDSDSLLHAFEGATQLLIVSSNAQSYGGDPLAQHRAAIEAARRVGAQRVLYTSHMGASEHSAFPPMRDHHATEQMLRESGLRWTALRNGFYASSGLAFVGDALETGVLAAPADGKVSWTAHADLAEAAAIILAGEHTFDGPTPPLTGPEALDLADFAVIASDLLSDPVVRTLLEDDALRGRLVGRGVPATAVEIVLGFYAASRKGEFSALDPTLERLLGRPPTRMRDVVEAAVSQH